MLFEIYLDFIHKWTTALRCTLYCSVISVHLTSSKSFVGIAGVISEIQKEKKVLFHSLFPHLIIPTSFELTITSF